MRPLPVCLLVCLAMTLAAGLAMADEASEPAVVFEQHVLPILQARCIKCHGEGKLEAGLDLRRKFLIAKGGDSGPSLVDGKPDESLLWQRVEKDEMPPKEEGRLDQTQRALLRRWIAAGAPLAKSPEPPVEEAETAPRISPEDAQFWSFVPPKRAPLPSVQASHRAATSIDRFLLAKLEENGIGFSHEAQPEHLVRRATFALHGLPPTVEELADFESDDRPDRMERLSDRLLAAPRFGEHFARNWLDIAGYADSDGYLAADRLRPQAWRYRDYVISALNEDLPYDQFVLEQLAGDELSDWRRAEELSPRMMRQLVATGFLRTASDPTYPGYTEPNEIHQVMADTEQILSSAFLGLTMQCARCHAHKNDPISQRDYYAIQAIFRPALDPQRWQPSEVRGIVLATESQQARAKARNEKIDQRLADLKKEWDEATARYRKKRLLEHLQATGITAGDAATTEKLIAAILVAVDKRNDEQKAIVAQFQATNVVLAEADLEKWSAEYRDESVRFRQAVAAETALKQQHDLVRGIADLDDKPAPCHLLLRGDYNKPGPVVEPGVPQVLTSPDFQLQVQSGYRTTGRREAFARWLVSPQQPLTSRVRVNQLWAHLFGRGIVTTLANFGRSGARPTHPELLDWLAVEFRANGWSQKRLVRDWVLSNAWRQSSEASSAALAADPENRWLSAFRARRHTGEMLRDTTLMVCGKLRERMFGVPSPVAAQGDGSVIAADDAAGNRRSIYLIVRRSQHLTMLDLFDVPTMEVNCPQRGESIVPLQALAMLHGPFAEQAAVALADRLYREAPASDEAKIELAWRLLFSRKPAEPDRQSTRDFLAAVVQEKLGDRAMTADSVARAEALRFAWNQAALVLLNSNEFIYVP